MSGFDNWIIENCYDNDGNPICKINSPEYFEKVEAWKKMINDQAKQEIEKKELEDYWQNRNKVLLKKVGNRAEVICNGYIDESDEDENIFNLEQPDEMKENNIYPKKIVVDEEISKIKKPTQLSFEFYLDGARITCKQEQK